METTIGGPAWVARHLAFALALPRLGPGSFLALAFALALALAATLIAPHRASSRVTLIPCIHVSQGTVASPAAPVDGKPAREVGEALLAKHGKLCIVDLDGIQGNKPDLPLLQKLSRRGEVWADAGSRFAHDAMDLVVAGAHRVTLRLHTLASRDELAEAVDLLEEPFLGVEVRAGEVVLNEALGVDAPDRARDLVRSLDAGLVVIHLDRAGTVQGFDRILARRFAAEGRERWFAGGVRRREEVEELEKMGYDGVLVSRALLEGAWR